MTPPDESFAYRTQEAVACPHCRAEDVAAASTRRFLMHGEITLECRKCDRRWATGEEIRLTGVDRVVAGKDPFAEKEPERK